MVKSQPYILLWFRLLFLLTWLYLALTFLSAARSFRRSHFAKFYEVCRIHYNSRKFLTFVIKIHLQNKNTFEIKIHLQE
jgi:hypothetical protein